jgi:hypothetical protein
MWNIIDDICTCLSEVFAFGEEDELSCDDLSLVDLRAVFTVDDTSLEMSFDVDELALGEELFCTFCERPPSDTVRVLGFGESFSCGTLIVTVCRDSECCDFFVTSCCFDKWIFGNIADKDYLIDSTHREKS